MAKYRCEIPADYVEDLVKRTGASSKTEIVSEALAFFRWAVEEREQGRFVVAVNSDGTDPSRLKSILLETASVRGKFKE